MNSDQAPCQRRRSPTRRRSIAAVTSRPSTTSRGRLSTVSSIATGSSLPHGWRGGWGAPAAKSSPKPMSSCRSRCTIVVSGGDATINRRCWRVRSPCAPASRWRRVSCTASASRQVGLTADQRDRNVRGAFKVPAAEKAAVAGRRVLLVDDVYTKGATVKASTRALLRAGAVGVDVLVFARVVRGQS